MPSKLFVSNLFYLYGVQSVLVNSILRNIGFSKILQTQASVIIIRVERNALTLHTAWIEILFKMRIVYAT